MDAYDQDRILNAIDYCLANNQRVNGEYIQEPPYEGINEVQKKCTENNDDCCFSDTVPFQNLFPELQCGSADLFMNGNWTDNCSNSFSEEELLFVSQKDTSDQLMTGNEMTIANCKFDSSIPNENVLPVRHVDTADKSVPTNETDGTGNHLAQYAVKSRKILFNKDKYALSNDPSKSGVAQDVTTGIKGNNINIQNLWKDETSIQVKQKKRGSTNSDSMVWLAKKKKELEIENAYLKGQINGKLESKEFFMSIIKIFKNR